MKTVKIEVKFTRTVEVPDDWDDDAISFHFEENFCVGNHIEAEHRAIEAHSDVCNICHRATVKVLD